jgi:Tol biopolymer transport system component
VPPEVRFAVSPAADGSFEGYPALSPDGRRLAYVLGSENGLSTLWLHSFETGTARELPGTEDADEPFWSPDGRFLAFFARGELRKLELASGIVQPLCAAPDPRGGTWGSRGEILFGTTVSAGLRQVRAGGGAVEVVTEVDVGRGEASHRFPWFLPDGRHYVFTILGTEVTGLYFAEAGASGYRKVSPEFSRAEYDARGHLLFLRSGTLLAQSFDAERGVLEGDPSPVGADRVGADVGLEGWFAAGPGVAAYRPSTYRSSRLVWVDRSGRAVGEVTSPGAYGMPTLSRDGRKAATSVVGPDRTRVDVWIYETSGLDRGQRLPLDARLVFTPIWSPDGRWIAYKPRGGTLARRATSGTGREEVLVSGGHERSPCDWSPDGRTLLFEQFSEANGADLWTLDVEPPHAARPVLEGRGNQAHAVFSPDGRLLAYTSDEAGEPQVFVETFPPSGARWQVTTGGGDQPSWRADGQEIYYVGIDRMLYAVPVRSLSPLTVGPAEPLFRLQARRTYVTGPRTFRSPAPDGQRFLVNMPVSGEAGSRIDVVLNWTQGESSDGAPRPAP